MSKSTIGIAVIVLATALSASAYGEPHGGGGGAPHGGGGGGAPHGGAVVELLKEAAVVPT